jgi:predicted GH43/DUF377 family glycosyl hydrolase
MARHRKLPRNVVQRSERNPLISLDDLPFAANDVHNAGAVKHEGRYVLLVTIERLDGRCVIHRAESEDGHRFEIDPEPVLAPSAEPPYDKYESDGVRDARITPFDGGYYVTYLAQSEYGFRLGLGRTENLRTIERIALVSEPDTKNGTLFPRKVDGRFARLERPREGGNIWVSYSEDLRHWGGWDVVMTPRSGYWDCHRIGAAAPPIEVECGWLLVYYGVKNNPSGPLFRLGIAFLDRDNPVSVIGRSNIPVLAPREKYERIGDVANLIFSCGALLNDAGDDLVIYYGAANSCICRGSVGLEALERTCNPEKAVEENS